MFGKRTTSGTTATVSQTEAVVDESGYEEPQPLWEPAQAKSRKSVDGLLLERGQVTEEQLAQAKTVQAQTPEVVAHLALGHALGRAADQRRPVVTKVAVGKTPR